MESFGSMWVKAKVSEMDRHPAMTVTPTGQGDRAWERKQ